MPVLADLEDLEGYCRLFTDVALWAPYAREVCLRHGLRPAAEVRGTLPGTCPTFIVDERWVVKFFGRLFDGGPAFLAEREANRIAAQIAPPSEAGPGEPPADEPIPFAPLLASGELGGDGWPWPYLIFAYIPSVSIGAVREQIDAAGRLEAARRLGSTLRRLHALPLDGSPVFPNSHRPFLRLLQEQRAGLEARLRAWGSLPARLIDQIDEFLLPLEDLVEWQRPPHLIHADLTGDHLLGRLEGGRWSSLALIDFGDAMTGSLYYELAALHLDLFAAERPLLSAFLDAYGLPPEQRAGLPRRAMAAALLHRFDVFAPRSGGALETAGSLEQLAEMLWQV